MKEKTKKCDQCIKSWLEWRNQQEQSSGGVLSRRFSEKLPKIHRKICVLGSLSKEDLGLETCSVVKK